MMAKKIASVKPRSDRLTDYVQLHGTTRGNLSYEELTPEERSDLLALYSQTELLYNVMVNVKAGTLFGRMLIAAIGEAAGDDPNIRNWLVQATPKKSRVKWDKLRCINFLKSYYIWKHIGTKTRGDLMDILATEQGFNERQSVENILNTCLEKYNNDKEVVHLRKALAEAGKFTTHNPIVMSSDLGEGK